MLSAGTRLGSYEVTGSLGAGGMGEVYRARDTKLNRDVAIKVLPDLFAADLDRLRRFEREAQTLAALNHPNIAQVFGVLETPAALVMECVDGEDLSQRISRGPIAIDDALSIARQIADALEGAHERGIIHRDLKPANIKVREDGAVKVLDFGLAKAVETSSPDLRAPPASVMNSPTFTSPAMTQFGVILGTAAYMAPEQARGKAVDKRADIWAFGVVLFEMLAGRRAFEGDELSDVLAAVLRQDINWKALPGDTPPWLRRLLERCLERDVRQRLRDIGEARVILEARAPSEMTAVQTPVIGAVRGRLPWLVAGAALVVALAAGAAVLRMGKQQELQPLQFTIRTESTGTPITARLSPDGTRIALATTSGVWVRRLDSTDLRQLSNHASVRQVFWSPDSSTVGIATARELLKIPVDGGTPERIADISRLPGPFNPIGGDVSWLADDRIVFVTGMSGVLEVSARGGEPSSLVAPGSPTEDFHGAAILPSGGIVTSVHDGDVLDTIALLRNGMRTVVHQAKGQTLGMPVFSPTGHLLFPRLDAPGVWALAFDEKAGKASGAPFLVLAGKSYPSVSADGRLLLGAVVDPTTPVRIALVERGGREIRQLGPASTQVRFSWPDLSADGRLALIGGPTSETPAIWVHRIDTAATTQLPASSPVASASWLPGEQEILVVSGLSWCMTGDCFTIGRRRLDGGVTTPVAHGWSPDVSADGRSLVYSARLPQPGTSEWDLVTRDLNGQGQATPFQVYANWQYGARFSPDGRYVAYVSRESGQDEIYVARFPSGERWRVTDAGGQWPQWRRDGARLYFARGSSVMEVSIDTTSGFSVGPVVEVLPHGTLAEISFLEWRHGFDVNADGSRFLVTRPVDQVTPAELHVMQNWAHRFRR